MKKGSDQSAGVIYTAIAYLLWGIFPLYWKLLSGVPSGEILAHRVIWSFVFMIVLLLVNRKIRVFFTTFKQLLHKPKQFVMLVVASLLISANWGIYIWAVNQNHIIEASLGYYINPLISILLGIIVLKEKLNFWQGAAVLVAAAGVVFLTFNYGHFPWVSLALAFSFGLYGLAKKMISFEAEIGLTLETMMVTPLALIYIVILVVQGHSSFGTTGSIVTTLLMVGGGVATAIPLLYFAKGAKLIPLSMIGFLQYIAPTLSLLLGVFVYHEHFTYVHMIAFSCIWIGSVIFSLSHTKFMVNHQPKWSKRSVGM
ncbi:EamA family transporter RarD [Priestia koreensis]|uniref:EamA family transporter RarD n=1 Tax=Priestia koreensis TaxID=284581 RepID=UPI003CFFC234